jgi:dTDP-4-dehydrorhamnose reductase/dTDP-4-dehydrorhamnose 3,5-epimerase
MVNILKKWQKEKYAIKERIITMKIIKTEIAEVLIIEPKVFGDYRGWFTETYSKEKFKELGIDVDFVQDNHSFSAKKGTLRGLHFQLVPKAQTKLIRCTKGKILDIAVDLIKGSPTYKKWVSVELTEDNKKQLLIPKGFAHGFITLTDEVEVQYKVDEYYDSEHDRSIKFDDLEIGVNWSIDNPILSDKDLKAPLLKDSDVNFSIKVLVTGVNGQLGHDVVNRLHELGIDVTGVSRNEFDISDKSQTEMFISRIKPDVIVHCAAYTAVDMAEDEKELCYAVNVEGTRNIAETADAIDAKMVYISTDYVFDGTGEAPHLEDEETNPINNYGYTKEKGEKVVRELLDKHFIVRTSWVYGKNGNNFVKTMLKLAESKDEINVVSDQIGTPTYTKDLAVLIADMIQTTEYGTYHGVNDGYCSWYEYARAIFEKARVDIKVNPISSAEYPTKAKRPMNSMLSKVNLDKVGFNRLPNWEDALTRYLIEINR